MAHRHHYSPRRLLSSKEVSYNIKWIAYDTTHPLHRYVTGLTSGSPPDFLNKCSCQRSLLLPGQDRTAFTPLPGPEDVITRHRFLVEDRCRSFQRKYAVYGEIGEGSFGRVFAVLERDALPGQEPRRFAAKVIIHEPRECIHFPNGKEVDREAMILWYWQGARNLIHFHECYRHEFYTILVMDQFAVDHPNFDVPRRMDLQPSDADLEDIPQFPAYTADNLILYDWARNDPSTQGVLPVLGKTPRINTTQACKVTTELLNALVELDNRSACYYDLSPTNFLVDSELSVKLIDASAMKIRPHQVTDYIFWHRHRDQYFAPESLPALLVETIGEEFEGHLPDQLLMEMDVSRGCKVSSYTDNFVYQNYSFAVNVFELLHGHSPFERANEPCYPPFMALPAIRPGKSRVQRMKERYSRVLEHVLQIDGSLPQDAIDVLTTSLANLAEHRPPIPELTTFPWFSGWYIDSGEDFRRPPRLGELDD
ncbi:MAG: hypothetical protein M1814_000234 [Vezdaea aestivalis]|nr:MAG: hypothetical protein M1814_000234 [Vezdaea aestivalis]